MHTIRPQMVPMTDPRMTLSLLGFGILVSDAFDRCVGDDEETVGGNEELRYDAGYSV